MSIDRGWEGALGLPWRFEQVLGQLAVDLEADASLHDQADHMLSLLQAAHQDLEDMNRLTPSAMGGMTFGWRLAQAYRVYPSRGPRKGAESGVHDLYHLVDLAIQDLSEAREWRVRSALHRIREAGSLEGPDTEDLVEGPANSTLNFL